MRADGGVMADQATERADGLTEAEAAKQRTLKGIVIALGSYLWALALYNRRSAR